MKFSIAPDDSAQRAIEQAEERIAQLQVERATKIEEAGDDYVLHVSKIDREIASLRANVAVHRDRMSAMQAKRQRQVRARLEREKIDGIADIRKRLTRRHEAARKLDAVLKQLTEAFAECVRADEEAFSNWAPMVSPLGRLAHFRLEGLEPLSASRRPRPPSAGLVRSLAQHEPFNFAVAIEGRNAEVVEMLEGAPVPEELHEEAAA
jgi:DNA repair exonuclease SbcCD ATPase subunit